MTTSAPARERIPFIMRDLAARYLPAGDLHEGETALAKIVAEREDPFLVLISTILSQRTRDEMTERASRQLFAKYDTPEAIANADPANLVRLIQPVGFYRQKALQIQNVIRFGKDICRPIGPRCEACSFTSFCRYYRTVFAPKRRRLDQDRRKRSPGTKASRSMASK